MEYIKRYYASLTAFVVFLVYLTTLAPSVLQIDTGELASAQALLGIAHPTGYPLFTMLGYLFTLLPLPLTTILKLNLFACIAASLGIYFFIKTVAFILINISSFENLEKTKAKKKITPTKNVKAQKVKTSSLNQTQKKQDNPAIPYSLVVILSISGGLILAFGKTVWFQSTSVEVYSLHLCLISAAFFALVRAFVGESQSHRVTESRTTGNGQPATKDWLIFAGILALSFSNHMTTLLIIPATTYLFFYRFRLQKEGFITLAKMLALFFTLLILIYAYLPIRAGMNPEINWGNPIDFEKIMRHVSGKQYQVWLFSSSEAAAKNFARFFSGLPTEFYFSLLAVLVGIIYLMKRCTKLLVTSLLLIFGTVLYSINYDIVDLESYFLLAYLGMSLLSVFGLLFIYEKFKDTKAVLVVAGVLILSQMGFSYKEVNQSGNLIFEQYTQAILKTSPKNAIVFSYQWDYFLSASYYFQLVENLRSDVVIVDKELLRRSWYYNQLNVRHPEFTKSYKSEADIFLREVVPFEKDLPYDSRIIETAYRDVILAILLKNYKDRPVFIAPELVDKELANKEFELPANIKLVPDLFFYRITDNDEYIPAPDPDFVYETGGVKNTYTDQINDLTAAMLLRRVDYELTYKKKDRAQVYLDKLRKSFPDTQVPPELLEKFK
jgi:hypothetical protein